MDHVLASWTEILAINVHIPSKYLENIMFRTLILLSLAGLLPLSASAQNANRLPKESSDMQRIFNGKDLKDWDGDTRLWTVKDGVIRGETTEEQKANGNTFLIWKGGTTKDFDLRLSFRCNATNNSGIQYRSQRIPKADAKNEWVMRGYQHELRNEVEFPSVSGFIYGEQLAGRGRICLVGEKATIENGEKTVSETLITNDDFKKLFKLDDWNEVVIIARNRRIRHFMNGQLILDFTDSPELALKDGELGVQLHAGKPMWVEFKDIRIKELEPRQKK